MELIVNIGLSVLAGLAVAVLVYQSIADVSRLRGERAVFGSPQATTATHLFANLVVLVLLATGVVNVRAAIWLVPAALAFGVIVGRRAPYSFLAFPALVLSAVCCIGVAPPERVPAASDPPL